MRPCPVRLTRPPACFEVQFASVCHSSSRSLASPSSFVSLLTELVLPTDQYDLNHPTSPPPAPTSVLKKRLNTTLRQPYRLSSGLRKRGHVSHHFRSSEADRGQNSVELVLFSLARVDHHLQEGVSGWYDQGRRARRWCSSELTNLCEVAIPNANCSDGLRSGSASITANRERRAPLVMDLRRMVSNTDGRSGGPQRRKRV